MTNHTLLTGRTLVFPARPFAFSEYLSYVGVEVEIEDHPEETYRKNLPHREALAYHLGTYIQRGGFPEALKSESDLRRKILLQQYFEDILARDAVHRHRLRNPTLLRNLALVMMSDVSNLVSLGKTARILPA